MHILLGLLGTIVTIAVLFKRLSDAGIDIGWLNPFAWRRRRAWRKKYQGNPIFSLSDPLEVAALLATTTAKIDGDLSFEEKTILLELFQSEFHKSEKEASDLLMSSIYLFGDGEEAMAKPDKILRASLESFSPEKARSVMSLLKAISEIDQKNQAAKHAYIDKVEATFNAHFKPHDQW
jgi:hypothetical protein